jgi:tight adherence protein B
VTWAVTLVVLGVLLWPDREQGHDRPTAGPAPPPVPVPERLAQQWRSRRGSADDAWVADLADVVAVGLDAGLDLGRAVLAAARSPTVARRAPWLETRLAEALAAGEPVADTVADLVEDAGAPGGAGLRAAEGDELAVLVRAWRLTDRVGAAASATTAAAAGALRDRAADVERARALAAGPRASMWLLTALPVGGPLLGLLLGLGPGRLYASTPARVGAVLGLGLTLAGWVWARRVLRRAARPATTQTPGHG